MQMHCGKVLLCVTALILASSAAEARYWRHYGYHWYGRSWKGSPSNSSERQVEEQKVGTEPGNDPRQAGEFGAAIEQMINACNRQVAELKDMPLDAVARIVNSTPDQREALDGIRRVAVDASESLAATCPKNASASIHERLKALNRTLEAMAASLATLRPAFATFYGLLNDEQKARLVAITQSGDTPQSNEASRSRTSRDVPQRRGGSDGDLYCQQWTTYLRKMPVRQIEDRGHLSDEQHANLYDLAAVMFREAGRLQVVCHADDRFTPTGRLEARELQLKALAQSADAISPAFSRLEDDLTDPQKAQLQGILNLPTPTGQRSVRQ